MAKGWCPGPQGMGPRLAEAQWRRACYCDRPVSMAMSGLSVDGVVCPMLMALIGCCESKISKVCAEKSRFRYKTIEKNVKKKNVEEYCYIV